MATQTLREELLHLLTASAPRPSPCHGYQNCCACPKCQARVDENDLISYALAYGLKLDRPTARRLLLKHTSVVAAMNVVDATVSAAKRKMAA